MVRPGLLRRFVEARLFVEGEPVGVDLPRCRHNEAVNACRRRDGRAAESSAADLLERSHQLFDSYPAPTVADPGMAAKFALENRNTWPVSLVVLFVLFSWFGFVFAWVCLALR